MSVLQDKLKVAFTDFTDVGSAVSKLPKLPESTVNSSTNMIADTLKPEMPNLTDVVEDEEDKDLEKAAACSPGAGGFKQEGVFRNDKRQGLPEAPQQEGRMTASKVVGNGLLARKKASLGSDMLTSKRQNGRSMLSKALKSMHKKTSNDTNSGLRQKLAYAIARHPMKETTMPQKQTKLAKAELKKLAEVEAFDKEQAFELGFAKCAKDMKLTDTEFRQFYGAGCQKLASVQEQVSKSK